MYVGLWCSLKIYAIYSINYISYGRSSQNEFLLFNNSPLLGSSLLKPLNVECLEIDEIAQNSNCSSINSYSGQALDEAKTNSCITGGLNLGYQELEKFLL